MVGFGLDLSALQKDAPEAFRILNSQTMSMSAEMKRASREGAESFRLIDEALGIHVSRPLTRILTQEFPGLAKGLQSVLGAGVAGALGVAAFEAFEKISKGIENAKKALEEYSTAIEHTQNVIGDMGAAHVRAMKEISLELAALSGDPGAKLQLAQFKVDTSAMAEAKKNVEEISKALDAQAKAAEKAHGVWTQLVNTLVTVPTDFWTKLFGGAGEATNKLKEVDALVNVIMREHAGDPMVGLKESLKDVQEEARKTLAEMTALALGNAALANKGEAGPRDVPFSPVSSLLSPAGNGELAEGQQKANALAQTLIGLNAQIRAIQNAIDEAMGRGKIDAATSAIEAQKKVAAELSSLYKEMGDSLRKLQPETDPIKKLDAEIADMVRNAEAHFYDLEHAGASALQLKEASASIARLKIELAQIAQILKEEILQKQIPALTSKQTSGLPLPSLSLPGENPATPTLGSGGTTAAQFDAFSKDQAAQLKAAAAAYADIITPAQKYQLALQELSLLLQKGLIDQAAYTAAVQKAGEVETKAQLHLEEMVKELDKLLAHSTSAADGVKAFFLQLEVDASQNGKMTFELLNSSLKGFEDEVTKAIFTGKAHWRDYFRSLAEEAFKFMLNKDIAMMFKMLSGTGFGKSLGLGSLMQGGPAAAAQTANTTAVTALTTAVVSNTAAMVSRSLGGVVGTGGGGGIIGDLTDSGSGGFPGYASGTDDAPGGFAWVGEQGPELLGLPGGSSVTPVSSLRSGGGDQHFYIDAKGAEIGVEEKIVRALAAAKPRIIGEALANFSEVQKRTPQSR